MIFFYLSQSSKSKSYKSKLRYRPAIPNPSPNIQPRLHALRHRQPCMQRTLQALPLRVQVPPKNRIPRNRSKRDSRAQFLITIHPLAPFLVF
jgi:hypothetical protein